MNFDIIKVFGIFGRVICQFAVLKVPKLVNPFPKHHLSDNIHPVRRPSDYKPSASPAGVFVCLMVDDKKHPLSE